MLGKAKSILTRIFNMFKESCGTSYLNPKRPEPQNLNPNPKPLNSKPLMEPRWRRGYEFNIAKGTKFTAKVEQIKRESYLGLKAVLGG